MADLDVTEVLEDPAFRMTFDVERPTAGLDAHGRTIIGAPTVFKKVSGTIVPQKTSRLQRRDDGTIQPRSITVRTRFELFGAIEGHQPDIIRWNGNKYTAMSCVPWRFGRGFFSAVCETISTPDPAQ